MIRVYEDQTSRAIEALLKYQEVFCGEEVYEHLPATVAQYSNLLRIFQPSQQNRGQNSRASRPGPATCHVLLELPQISLDPLCGEVWQSSLLVTVITDRCVYNCGSSPSQ